MWYQVDTGYACAGIEVGPGWVVVSAAPIFRWMVGKRLQDIARWKKLQCLRPVLTK
jgi:hypothetical protein